MAQTRTTLDTFLLRPTRHVCRVQFIDGWTLTLQARHEVISFFDGFSPELLKVTRSRGIGIIKIAVRDIQACRTTTQRGMRRQSRRLSHYQTLSLNSFIASLVSADQDESKCSIHWQIETLGGSSLDGKVTSSLDDVVVKSTSFHGTIPEKKNKIAHA